MYLGKLSKLFATAWHQARTREDGNVAIIFAMSVIPIFLLMGFAIDLQQVNTSKNRVQHIIDSAVIAGAREMQDGKNDTEIKNYIKNYINSSLLATGMGGCQDPVSTISNATQDISVRVLCSQDTAIMQLAGVDHINYAVSSASVYGIGKVDVAFVFDTSGSMAGSRNEALKDAAELAVQVLLPDDSTLIDTGDVRIGMVSYSYGMDAGPYFTPVTGKNRIRTYEDTYYENVPDGGHYESVCNWWGCRNIWVTDFRLEERTTTTTINNTCVKERLGSEALTDAAPGPFAWIEATGATYNESRDRWTPDRACNSPPPVALTSNKTLLNTYIQNLPASGGTAGHLGIAWGWYLIAPEWKSIWPATSKPWDYAEPDTAKAMILMTDGEFNAQYNTSNGNSFGQSKKLCDAIKARGIKIYTVAFQAPSGGKAILNYCASGPDFAFEPENADELKDAYTNIAQSISDLRIRY
ncbi:pilus assembly protein TadG-related protein [Hyphomonas pacifica]|uniref:Uncharacterized protein n=1 Tax=Hyphomonas pacifica TaxID=1280941 RepID=A0A062U1E2_9PROT|nr:pilus assembly protein TadG-related protein [Hyphomonas pacifica]KCZ51558.1 hypothetical protein HY2_11155 [Hyphomonas pacifica]RAN34102.1 hypothetical protein HY3_11085 [Hyphomonas pacifica]RAN35882.1 hypothetical protein HY11_12935 [Hyphomonas pacifica]